MEYAQYITSLATSFLAAKDEPDRRRFLARFVVGNDAQSEFFKSRYLDFLDAQGIDAQGVPLTSILTASIIHFISYCLDDRHACLLFGPDDPFLFSFIQHSFKDKKFFAKVPDLTKIDRQLPLILPIKYIESIDSLPDAGVQQIVSFNSWEHEQGLYSSLPTKLAAKAVLTTLTYG